MKKYKINYSFDEQENKFVAVCPNLLGFVIYCESLKELKEQSLKLLKIYTSDKDLTGKNVEFYEKVQEIELGL